ncbi:recombinase family protein [Mesorhizobium sp. CO1-1-8]|uniref:recombinase family protein n=1 Tax=Mesorhizobium sp. CO1-1-8 TaxID=2876631 RepID=UPI0029624439|nr:recombinase family protein [Mesorhizobium sp. CO1-1-8]
MMEQAHTAPRPAVDAQRVRAAQYVRMSTDLQSFSIDNQKDAIREFAAAMNYDIVATYEDAGRSGLSLEGRAGLQRLLADVEAKIADFEIVIVYDVSRWGRFQNPDESASYEYRCRAAGVRIEYCGEQFANDGSIGSDLLKAIKRSMAAEHSRVLSVKVFAGQCRLIRMGYRQGGSSGLGLRRQLIDQHGRTKTMLALKEQKSLQTDRVILVPGPADEITTVRWIYNEYVKAGRTELQIARSLNAKGVVTDLNRSWKRHSIHQILSNEKYVGNNVWNRQSFKLKQRKVTNDTAQLVRADGVFEPIVDRRLFERAQVIADARSSKMSNGQMLVVLAELLKRRGTLSGPMIDAAADCPPSSRYRKKFGSLLRAYKLVGHDPSQNYRFLDIRRRLREILEEIVQTIVATIERAGGSAVRQSGLGVLRVNEEFTVSIAMGRCRNTPYGYPHWVASAERGPTADLKVAIRMSPDNQTILDYLIAPANEIGGKPLNHALNKRLEFNTFFFKSLDPLFALAERDAVAVAR